MKIRVSAVRFCPRPPYQDAQLFSVGRFHFGDRQMVRRSARFYVCHAPPASEAVMLPKSHTPLSLLTKLLRTLTKWHTQNAFCGNNLCVCRIRRFCVRLAEANHEVCVLSHTWIREGSEKSWHGNQFPGTLNLVNVGARSVVCDR